jgi:hypothetical protein
VKHRCEVEFDYVRSNFAPLVLERWSVVSRLGSPLSWVRYFVLCLVLSIKSSHPSTLYSSSYWHDKQATNKYKIISILTF